MGTNVNQIGICVFYEMLIIILCVRHMSFENDLSMNIIITHSKAKMSVEALHLHPYGLQLQF